MMYIVKKGYTYVDTRGRGQAYTGGQEVNEPIDETQLWKLGRLEPKKSELEIAKKAVKKGKAVGVGTPTDLDDKYYDEGEETE